ncbi:MAG: hypothetical protein FWH08_03180 [Oscillospiraceae bacterium]|nr:hypothetical protein [Oscillospiraceae bacterium]
MVLETQIIAAVIEYLNGRVESLSGFSPIVMGGMVAGQSGISAEIAPGYAKSAYLAGGVFQRMPILLIIREQRRQNALETAFNIAEAVRRSGDCKTEKIHQSVAGISMGTGPEFVQRSGADYIYSLIFNIDYMCGAPLCGGLES